MLSTLLPRFARDAVILLDQIHLRFSCPPFIQRKSKIEYERLGTRDTCIQSSIKPLQKENYE
jgi:hypothetical protein